MLNVIDGLLLLPIVSHPVCCCVSVFVPVPVPLPAVDVHPDHHADHLCEPECLRVPGAPLHAQGVRGARPSGAECGQAHAQPQGSGDRRHNVQQVQPQSQPAAQRRSAHRALPQLGDTR